jgi:DNA-binding NtrC family response regulator
MTTASRGTILLREDNDVLRELVASILADDGHDVRACASTSELVVRAADLPDALALVDYRGSSFSELWGDEYHALAAVARAVPTVIVTDQGWADEQLAQELGLLAVLRKPFEAGELSEIVRSCVAHLRASNEGHSAAGSCDETMTTASCMQMWSN